MDKIEIYKGFEIRAFEREQDRWRAEIRECPPLTHAASVDCLLYLSNRGLRRESISGRSDRHAVSAVPHRGF